MYSSPFILFSTALLTAIICSSSSENRSFARYSVSFNRKDACKTYRHNFGGDYLVEGDIKQVNAEDIPDIDILNGGFPCQAFSIAGLRKGFEDERGNLFFEIERILRVKRPRAVLLENVRNLESHDNGNTFRVIREHLQALGYYVCHRVLNTME